MAVTAADKPTVAPNGAPGSHIAGGCYKRSAPNGAMNPRLVQPNKALGRLWDSSGTALGQLWDKLWDKQVY